MLRLKITRASGDVTVMVTPVVEYAFEKHFSMGIAKRLREAEQNSDIYWLAHNALQRVEVIPPFGDEFLSSLIDVEILDEEPVKK